MKTEKRHEGTPMFGENGYLKKDLEKAPHSVQRYVMMLEQALRKSEQTANAKAKAVLEEAAEKVEKELNRIVVQDYGNVNDYDLDRIQKIIRSLIPKEQ